LSQLLPLGARLFMVCSMALFAVLSAPNAAIRVEARPAIVPASTHDERNVTPGLDANPRQAQKAASGARPVPGASSAEVTEALGAPAALDETSFEPTYVYLTQMVAVRYPLPTHRRPQLASRAGRSPQTYRVVYERKRVPVDISPIIVKNAKKHKLDPYLIKAVISVESNFENFATSCVGAAGLMQLMPGTGAWMGARDLYDPEQNIAAGSRYLRMMLDEYKGRLELAIAAYNAGPGNVSDRIPNITETKNYVVKVMKAYKGYAAVARARKNDRADL